MKIKIILILLISQLLFLIVLSDEINKNNNNNNNNYNDNNIDNHYTKFNEIVNNKEIEKLVLDKLVNQIQKYANKYNLNQYQFLSIVSYACSFKPEKCLIYNGELPETALYFAKSILSSKSKEIAQIIRDNIKSTNFNDYFIMTPETNQKLERLLINLNLIGGLISGVPSNDDFQNTKLPPTDYINNKNPPPKVPNFQQSEISPNPYNGPQQSREEEIDSQHPMDKEYIENQHIPEMAEKSHQSSNDLQQQLEKGKETPELVPLINGDGNPEENQVFLKSPFITKTPSQLPIKTSVPAISQTLPSDPPKTKSDLDTYSNYFNQFMSIYNMLNTKNLDQENNPSDNNLSQLSPAIVN